MEETDYQFNCHCEFCNKITKHFNLKSEYHARFLGYQIG